MEEFIKLLLEKEKCDGIVVRFDKENERNWECIPVKEIYSNTFKTIDKENKK